MAKRRKLTAQQQAPATSQPEETIQDPSDPVDEISEVPIETEVPINDTQNSQTLENQEIDASAVSVTETDATAEDLDVSAAFADPDDAVADLDADAAVADLAAGYAVADPEASSAAADPDANANAGEDPAAAAVNGDGEEMDDDTDPIPINDLLDPFPKEQLVDLLRSAAEKHPDILDEVRQIADSDPTHRKIFVHGLGWDVTTSESLSSAFQGFGEIEDCKLVSDKASGRSKCYGFVLFKHRSGARRALREPQKKIGNRTASCQLASAGPPPSFSPAPMPPAPASSVSEYTQRKIFVSNVNSEIDPRKLLDFFSQFGEIEEGPLGLDKVTGKPKGFALFVYKSIEGSKKALKEPHKDFEGHTLHCQKAIDGPKSGKQGPSAGHKARPGFNPMQQQQQQQQQPSGIGHLMAPPAAGMGFNPVAGFNPAIGQALNAILGNQGAGFGLTNLLGQANQGQMTNPVPYYGNQAAAGNVNMGMMGGYGAAAPTQGGGYGNAPMGRGTARRGHPGGAAPYMGR